MAGNLRLIGKGEARTEFGISYTGRGLSPPVFANSLGSAMLRKQLWIGCLFIAVGIAWPTVSIVRGLKKFSDTYRSAAKQHQDVRSTQQEEVISSVEQGISSIVGGLITGLFGIGLALGSKRDSVKVIDEPAVPVDA